MAGLTFDDLVPPGASPPGASALGFDDLIPTQAPEPEPLRVPVRADSAKMKVIRAEREAAARAGEPQEDPYQKLLLQGASFDLLDEVKAGLGTPIQMVKRGTFNPAEAYDWAKENENWELEDARKRAGVLGTVAEIAGGVGSGVGLLSGARLVGSGASLLSGAPLRGATMVPSAPVSLAPSIQARLGQGLLGTTAGSAADAGVMGAVAGFGSNEGSDRFTGALQGGAGGAVLGAGIPAAGAAIGFAAAPVVSNLSALARPQRFADLQLGRALQESGRTPDEVAARVARAGFEGQGEYRLMDALGNAGRRKAAVVAKNPGEGRTQLVDFLDDRQAGQAGRVAGAIEEGLGAPETATQATLRLQAARRAQDDVAFDALRNNAVEVDVMPVANLIDSIVQPGMTRASSPAGPVVPDSIEAILGNARGKLERDGVSRVDFGTVQRTRGDIADAADKAFRAGEGNKARLIRQVRDALDAQMENASAGYRDAMAASRRAAQTTEAVDVGSAAARRGRTENKVAAFNNLTPAQQAAFRTGYADPIIEKLQKSPMGTDASRPLTSQAFRTELPAFAVPGQADVMMGRLGREAEMFRTRHAAGGGSSTSENIADNAATGFDPAIVGQLLSGNLFGAGRAGLQRGYALSTGHTEEVRRLLAERLLNGSPAEIRALLAQLAARTQSRSQAGAGAVRGIVGGILPVTTGQ